MVYIYMRKVGNLKIIKRTNLFNILEARVYFFGDPGIEVKELVGKGDPFCGRREKIL